MQKYTEKLPVFTAARFTMDTIDDVTKLARTDTYTIESKGNLPPVMTIKGLTLPTGDYLVRSPDGSLGVMTHFDMRERFDPVDDEGPAVAAVSQKSRPAMQQAINQAHTKAMGYLIGQQAAKENFPKADQWPPHMLYAQADAMNPFATPLPGVKPWTA
jgi:hypothetical protein